MSLTITNISHLFSKYLPREELKQLSYDSINNYSVINSNTKWYDFDKSEGHEHLKTIDSSEIIDNKLILAEFKNETIRSGNNLKNLKLKAFDSLVSLYELLKKDYPTINFSDIFDIEKECYFVFSKHKTSPTQLIHFMHTHRVWKKYYENTIYTSLFFMNCEQFKKKFNL